jgi:hypothetical protein
VSICVVETRATPTLSADECGALLADVLQLPLRPTSSSELACAALDQVLALALNHGAALFTADNQLANTAPTLIPTPPTPGSSSSWRKASSWKTTAFPIPTLSLAAPPLPITLGRVCRSSRRPARLFVPECPAVSGNQEAQIREDHGQQQRAGAGAGAGRSRSGQCSLN